MKNNETGEFELVLGNRQLLSGFFIVVILFAVFFVMGYFVGRSSSPPAKLAADTGTGAGAAPAATDTRPQPASGAPAAQTPAPAAAQPSAEEPAGETQPATRPTRAAEPKTEAPAAPPPEPAGGTYLQVMAVRREEAEVVARTLKDKGFPSTLSPAPTGLTRVLVGPYTDTASLGKAKAELENAGFHPMVKR